jgi:Cd2+/Zn2+-exporting ATPase
MPGVASASVSFGAGTMDVVRDDEQLTPDDIVATVAQAGYTAKLRNAAMQPQLSSWWRSRRVFETILAVVLWIVGFGIEQSGVSRVWSAIPFLAAMIVAGYPVVRAAWFALRARRADMNVLMSIAAIGAVAIGEWGEGSSVLILFAIGLMLQTLTLDRTRRAIQGLLQLAPQEANVMREGSESRVAVAEVQIGEIVIVRPGDRVPVDGNVIVGESSVDQSPITGESIPVEVEPGSKLFAGSINGDGVIEVRTTKSATDTTLARIIYMVEEAQSSKAPAQAFVDRFAAVYTPLVVAAAIFLATVGPLVVGDAREWFFRALVLLVVACPCALVISTPVALVSAIGSASRRGVLFKGGSAIEALAGVTTVAFDKTGTLTMGRLVVADVVPLDGTSENDLLSLAAAVESGSTHPIALGIVRAARERGIDIPASAAAQGLPGRGARAVIDGRTITLGSRRLFGTLPGETEDTLAACEQEGKTAVLVSIDGMVMGLIAVADRLRSTSRDVIVALHELQLRLVMLTGDNRHTAERIAVLVGVDDVRAELLPEDKVHAVAAIQREAPVAMVGDGVNDAPALATATVGVAMGVSGSDAAIEAADVALLADDLAQLPVAIRLARQTLAIIRQNIAASVIVKAAFLVLTVVGITNLWIAVLADMGMSLLVTLNSLRLVRAGATSHVAREEQPRITDDEVIVGSAG